MRTTLDLPDETFRKLKAEAALRGFKLKELVAQFIERGLEAGSATPIIAEPRRRPPIPIARKADGSVTPALSNAALDAILDEQAGRLVSLDSDFQRFTGLNFLHLAPLPSP